jgi:hypothetical protein
VIFFALWQIALTGYTYVAAGHAAREGARQLAVDDSDTGNDPPYRKAAMADLPKTWQHGAEIKKDGSVTVSVKLKVPLLIPGLRTPWEVGSTADTSVEDSPLPGRQTSVATEGHA